MGNLTSSFWKKIRSNNKRNSTSYILFGLDEEDLSKRDFKKIFSGEYDDSLFSAKILKELGWIFATAEDLLSSDSNNMRGAKYVFIAKISFEDLMLNIDSIKLHEHIDFAVSYKGFAKAKKSSKISYEKITLNSLDNVLKP